MQVLAQITLNFQQPNFVTVYAAQNDRLSRYINAALLDGATSWTIPTGALMTIRYRKPDGTSGWYDTLEDGSPAYTIEEDGSITFGLAEQALTVPGMVPVELNFYNAAGSKLSTLTFIVAVKPSAYSDEDIASSDYYNILTAKMQQLAELADSAEDDYQDYLSALSGFVGAPRTAAVAADMLDTGLIYVYTGNETGWTYGDWYYYNGREWTSGGVYNSAAISLDDTLTNANKPAQAKAAGDLVLVQDTQPAATVNKLWFPLTDPTDEQVPTWDEFSDLKSSINGRIFSDEVKAALLECFANLAWSTPEGQIYYDALEAALNPPADLVSITAVYTQTMIVYNTDGLSVLRPDLVVTAHYSDSSSAQLYGYLLSGTLTAGTSTITATYGGKTATFNVTVTDAYLLYKLPQETVFDGSAAGVIDTGAPLIPQDRDITILIDFTPTTSARQYVFFDGMYQSPYHCIGMEAQKNTFVWCVEGYASQNNNVELANITVNNRARAVIRHQSGSGKVKVVCKANDQTVSGETSVSIVSQNNLIVGGYIAASTSLAFHGTISEFEAHTRYFSDAEAADFVNGGV